MSDAGCKVNAGQAVTEYRRTAIAVAVAIALQPVTYADELANGSEEAETTVDEVVVLGKNFKYNDVESANKMMMDARDVPQTVKIVTRDLIDFAHLTKFEDIYKIDAGGLTSHAGDQFPRNYYRGFYNFGINTIKVDGFRLLGTLNLDLAPFERIEVVKGATSTLYGQNSVAGTTNAISRQPSADPGGSFSLEAGSWNHYRADADLYGALNDSGTASFRLVGAYLNEDSYLDFYENKRIVVAPSVRLDLGTATSLTLRVDWQGVEYAPFFGFGLKFTGTDINDPAQLTEDNFQIPDAPRSRNGNFPWGWADKDVLLGQAVLEHEFTNDWMLRSNLQYNVVNSEISVAQSQATDPQGFTNTYSYAHEIENDAYAGEVNLFGDVEILGRDHTLFVGVDYARLTEDFLFVGGGRDTTSGFMIENPDYSLIPARGSWHDFPQDSSVFFSRAIERNIAGITLQALLHPTDRLTVSLGSRYSHDVTETKSKCCGFETIAAPYGEPVELREDEVTFQGGVTFAYSDTLNLYASYGETFEPQPGFVFSNSDPDGSEITPETGVAYELGAKGELLNQAISWSAAIFWMERNGISAPDPENPGFVIPFGTQRAKGVELDFQGEPVAGWDVYASLAFLDNFFVEEETSGNAPNAPKIGVSLFTSYTLQSGGLKGLGFGGGVVYKDRRTYRDTFGYAIPVEFHNLFDDYTEVDVRVFYDRERWSYELSATNVLDTKYYSPAIWTVQGINVNPGRNVLGKVSYRF